MFNRKLYNLLPPAYVVRREGTVFTGVCLSTGGGYRSPGTPPRGGYQSPGPGPPQGGVPGSGTPPGGGTKVRVPPPGGGGTRVRYPPPGGGTRVRYPPRGGCRSPGTPPGGGGYLTRVGQQKEYSLHGGRYASCVHAGGLSCWWSFHTCNTIVRAYKLYYVLCIRNILLSMSLKYWRKTVQVTNSNQTRTASLFTLSP